MKIIAHFKYGQALTLLLVLSLLTACSGIKTYPNTMDKNLHVTTETDSGSVFSSLNTSVDIYQVKADCTIEYTGSVQLDSQSVDIGIPTERSSYLVFVFASSGFFSNSSMTSYDTLLRPRKGYNYNAKVSYMDDIYNVVMQETPTHTTKNRVIDAKELAACRPL